MSYQDYVFNVKKREFVGEFEEMYRHEDTAGYDSWSQEDITDLPSQIALAILNRYNFTRILDIGCGKGAFTHLLQKANNKVTGIDISATAIQKAKVKYSNIDFKALSVNELMTTRREEYDLVVMKEILSYLENWQGLIRYVSEIARYIFVSLYLPPDPIGFVESFDNLKYEIIRHFSIEAETLVNNEVILILGNTKREGVINGG